MLVGIRHLSVKLQQKKPCTLTKTVCELLRAYISDSMVSTIISWRSGS
jgi:hypothetical protein